MRVTFYYFLPLSQKHPRVCPVLPLLTPPSTTLCLPPSVLPLPSGSLHLIASAAFLNEGVLFFLHSTSHHGVEPRYHALLTLIVLACALFTFLGAFLPHSFLLDTAGNAAVLLQGLWFWQVGRR